MAYIQPIQSVWDNTSQNIYTAELTYSDRGNADTSNCFPMPTRGNYMNFRNIADNATIKPMNNRGNVRIATKPFLIRFALCNVQGFPISVQVTTIAWNKTCTATSGLVAQFLDQMFEQSYAVQVAMTPTINTNPTNPTPQALNIMTIKNQVPQMENYQNSNTTAGVAYHLMQGEPDWYAPNMRQRFKRLVRRKKIMLPAGAMYHFAVKIRPPKYLNFIDLTSDRWYNLMQRALMISFKSECGVRGDVDPAGNTNQYATVSTHERIILPLKAEAHVKAKMQYIWPHVHIYARDIDMANVGASATGQLTAMNMSAQATNLAP